ncbi:N-terminal acetyltransferase 2 [Yarrowia sp. C11]|nr:N-terminal acetyltransferase 2 [Yarrowia sp. C11]KAG5364451.1 N-terminal acetyltransferase 2 [Yarrowia sp. E02]
MNIRGISRGLLHVSRAAGVRGPAQVTRFAFPTPVCVPSRLPVRSFMSTPMKMQRSVGQSGNVNAKTEGQQEGQGGKQEGQEGDKKKATGIKALVQKYGWVALGVYLSLSTIDLPICWLGVHSVGLDKVVEWQVYLKELVGWKTTPKEEIEEDNAGAMDIANTVTGALAMVTPDIEAAVEDQKVDEKLPETAPSESYWFSKQMWAEFAVAYAIHKSLIFIRLPITAAITPSVVKILKRWGFNIGKKAPVGKFGVSPSQRQKWWSWWF